MKRYILAGIILFFVLSGIVIFNPAKPQHNSSNNKPAAYEYYYNENEDDEEDSLLPEDLSSILSNSTTRYDSKQQNRIGKPSLSSAIGLHSTKSRSAKR